MRITAPPNWFDQTPDSAFLRERQLVGDWRDPNSPRLLPFSRATLWRLVKAQQFPAPQKLGPNITAWKCGDVRAYLLSISKTTKGVAK